MGTLNEGVPIFMSKQLTPKQWKNCFKKYENYDEFQFWNYYATFKKNKTITQWQKRWFLNTYVAYKNGNTNIIYSMTGWKIMNKLKMQKKLIEMISQGKI